jgi:hypothetical protein
VELDCEHPQDGIQIVRLLVSVSGVKKLLSICPFPGIEQDSKITELKANNADAPDTKTVR